MEESGHTSAIDYLLSNLDGWQRLVHLTDLDRHHPITGWDRLVQALFEAPTAHLRDGRRIAAISALYQALCELHEREFAVIVLRYGITADDRPVPQRSRREVSKMLELSHSRIAQLESGGLGSLRAELGGSVARLESLIHLSP